MLDVATDIRACAHSESTQARADTPNQAPENTRARDQFERTWDRNNARLMQLQHMTGTGDWIDREPVYELASSGNLVPVVSTRPSFVAPEYREKISFSDGSDLYVAVRPKVWDYPGIVMVRPVSMAAYRKLCAEKRKLSDWFRRTNGVPGLELPSARHYPPMYGVDRFRTFSAEPAFPKMYDFVAIHQYN